MDLRTYFMFWCDIRAGVVWEIPTKFEIFSTNDCKL